MTHDIPSPTDTKRDTDGRIVKATIGKDFSNKSATVWLIACDGSSHAKIALEKSLALLNVTPNSTLIQLVNVQSWMSKEAAEHELLARGWHASETMRALLDKHALNWNLHVIMGDDIADALLAIAEELACDGVIVGSKGLGATESILLGSVATQIVHRSQLPVLVVH
jgi:nucleotide-binding universal stress UspA family protein